MDNKVLVGSICGLLANMPDCDIVVSELISSYAITFTFGLIF